MTGKGYNLALPGAGRRVKTDARYANRTEEVAELRRRLAEQTALAGEMADRLRQVEWVGKLPACLWCGGKMAEGHFKHCKLVALLATDATQQALARRVAEHTLIDTAIQFSQALPNDPSILDGSLRRALDREVAAYERIVAVGKEGG